jgi:hypothetical protein
MRSTPFKCGGQQVPETARDKRQHWSPAICILAQFPRMGLPDNWVKRLYGIALTGSVSLHQGWLDRFMVYFVKSAVQLKDAFRWDSSRESFEEHQTAQIER